MPKVNLIRRKEGTKLLCDKCKIQKICTVYKKLGGAFGADQCEGYEEKDISEEDK